MCMQLVFNELSLSQKAINKQELDRVCKMFLETYSSILREFPFVSRGIFTSVDINSIELYPGYYFSQWRNSKGLDPDDKRRILGLCERQNIVLPSTDDCIYVECNGKSGQGLLIAYEQDNPIVSFAFVDTWKTSPLSCTVCDLEKNEENSFELINFHDQSQIIEYGTYFEKSQSIETSKIQTPTDFLSEYKELFPSLIFHENALTQINSQIAPAIIPIIVRKLMKLERYFSGWDGGVFDTEKFPSRFISPESKQTLERFKAEHTYKWNKKDIIVSYHVRYTGGDVPGRIYVYPDHFEKKGIICSLHTKLPTVKTQRL